MNKKQQGKFIGEKKSHKILKQVLDKVKNFVKRDNKYYKTFKFAADEMNKDPSKNIIVFSGKGKQKGNANPYNKPSINQICAIVPEYDPKAQKRDIIAYRHPKKFNGKTVPTRMDEKSACYDPMHYVLLFPFGADGYTYEIENDDVLKNDEKKINATRFYSYRIMDRVKVDTEGNPIKIVKKDNGGNVIVKKNAQGKIIPEIPDYEIEFNRITHGKFLYQQYLVDQAAKIEAERFAHYCSPKFQKQYRNGKYCEVMDAYTKDDLENTGKKRIILPASHSGSPRNMRQKYYEAMAICRALGKPNLFITVTANPKWKEIQDELKKIGPHIVAEDRPDIVVRVFNEKLKEMFEYIDNGLFGEVVARMHVIEFQQRGLPHAHMAIVLKNSSDGPTKVTNFENFTTAELPNPKTQPRLFKIITDMNLHNACDGKVGYASNCINKETKKCKKIFS